MRLKTPIIFILAIVFLTGVFCFSDFARTESDLDDITVQMNVEEDDDGGTGLPPINYPPQITDVVAVAAYYSATVSFTATDDGGVTGVTFVYGLTTAYASSTTVTGEYLASLNNLVPSSTYYYRIVASDGAGQTATYEGSFVTSPANQVNSLKIIAKPEKRVFKDGGNLALTGRLIVYNPNTSQVLSSMDVDLSASGSTTYNNIAIGTGTGLHVIFKGRSHLAKRLTGVDILPGGDVVIDFTVGGTVELYAGDVQGAGIKDNLVDILDVSMTDTQFNTVNMDADLNRDGAVDVLDMSIVLVNYGKGGDIIPTG